MRQAKQGGGVEQNKERMQLWVTKGGEGMVKRRKEEGEQCEKRDEDARRERGEGERGREGERTKCLLLCVAYLYVLTFTATLG